MSDNAAILAGYTDEVIATNASRDLHLFIKPGTDLDSAFRAFDADAQEWVRVNGWLFVFETVARHLTEEQKVRIVELANRAEYFARLADGCGSYLPKMRASQDAERASAEAFHIAQEAR